jgi:hypothetical protein
MMRVSKWIPTVGIALLFTANVPASPPAAGPDESAAVTRTVGENDREVKPLLDKLSELSRLISENAQSPQAWRYPLEQADVLLQLAGRSKGEERDKLLRMAIDSFYSAAVLSPGDQPAAYERLLRLPEQFARALPSNPLAQYAMLQEIQADCMRELEKNGGDRAKAQEHRRVRLMRFARENIQSPEAPGAVLEAAQISETSGAIDEACRCYRYLNENFPGHAAGRKAGGALWRLGKIDGPVRLEMPLLYAPSGDAPFDLAQLRGKLVVVYFWSSIDAHAADDFRALKQLTDHYGSRGVEVVYVNMDDDPAKGRALLSGQLTAGVHVYQSGGLAGAAAERYGILELPHAFLVGKDGTLLGHSLPAAQLESHVTQHLHTGG